MLIDTEVGEVDVSFLDVLELGGVLVCCKPGEALIEDKNLERVVAGDQDIDSQIVFIVVYEVGVGDVLGGLVVFSVLNFSVFGDHSDASSTGGVGGF